MLLMFTWTRICLVLLYNTCFRGLHTMGFGLDKSDSGSMYYSVCLAESVSNQSW